MADFGNLFSSSPNYGAAADDLFGGIKSGGDAMGSFSAAGASKLAAGQYTEAAQVTREQTAIKEEMASRQIFQANSSGQSQVAGAGFNLSGSAQDLMRSNSQQGAMTKATIAHQGALQADAYTTQAQAAKETASGQTESGIMSTISSVAMIALMFL